MNLGVLKTKLNYPKITGICFAPRGMLVRPGGTWVCHCGGCDGDLMAGTVKDTL